MNQLNQSQNKKCIKYKLVDVTNNIIPCIKPIKAIAFFNGQINGIVTFEEDIYNDIININVDLKGFIPNTKHGFHVHEAGDLSKGCASMCAHFNPFGKKHGGRNDFERHVGDLGNIVAGTDGCARETFSDNLIKLRGDIANVIGRGLIIHEDEDDCGKGGNEESLKTGNAGKRIACGIIGYVSC